MGALLLVVALGAWDDFAPLPATADRVAGRTTTADLDEMQAALVWWQAQQREMASERVVQQRLAERPAAGAELPADKVKVEVQPRVKVDAKTQAALDAAEARAADQRLKCSEHPDDCAGLQARRPGESNDALAAREAALKTREEELAKRQKQLDEQAEKARQELERSRDTYRLGAKHDDLMRGVLEGLGR